jgi:flagellar hook-length control protein FliK
MMSVAPVPGSSPALEPPGGGVPDASALSFLASLAQVMGAQVAVAPIRPEPSAVPEGTAALPTVGAALAPAALAASPGLPVGSAVTDANPAGTPAPLLPGAPPAAPSAAPPPAAPANPRNPLTTGAQPATQPQVPAAAPRPAVADVSSPSPAPSGASRPRPTKPASDVDAGAGAAGATAGAVGPAPAEHRTVAASTTAPEAALASVEPAAAGSDGRPGGEAAPAAADLAPPPEVGSAPAAHHAGAVSAPPATVDGGAAAAPAPTRVPLPLVAGELVRAVELGRDALTIELEPVDLGRVEVSLTIDGSGRLRAELAAERPETLQLLQRDAKALEQALAGGGVQLADAGLSFSLRQDRGGSEQQAPGSAARGAEPQPAAASATPEPARRAAPSNRLLDLTV